jgi:hypothetical protein
MYKCKTSAVAIFSDEQHCKTIVSDIKTDIDMVIHPFRRSGHKKGKKHNN